MTTESETDKDTPLPPAAVIRNEFSLVELHYARRGDAISLVVRDTVAGNEIVLDSTELESLARAPHELFRKLLREIDAHHDNPE
ncbi:MAG: hypothetical protein GEU96_02480 [Propionibacteriales bacterium]|nr:hypothetical protein [Propionibacteriales bacterium]